MEIGEGLDEQVGFWETVSNRRSGGSIWIRVCLTLVNHAAQAEHLLKGLTGKLRSSKRKLIFDKDRKIS